MHAVTERRRRLAFVYDPFSFATMALVNAAAPLCDLQWIVDTSVPETELMSHLLRRLGAVVDVAGMSLDDAAATIAAKRPDGILALADSALLWTAQLAERLELAFIAPSVARAATDKYIQRRDLEAGGVSVPGHWPVPALDDAASWLAFEAQARFPALLKPRRGAGSRDVVLVRSLAQLHERLEELTDPTAAPDALLLEEYLDDRPCDQGQDFAGYVSVESIVSAGRISHVAITGRFPPAEPFRETGFFMPAALEQTERVGVLEQASAAVAALGVKLGCLHTEIKLTPDGPRVIELNARIGGSVARIMPIATGIDLLAVAMRLALAERIHFAQMPRCARVTFMLYVQAPAWMQRISAVDGLDVLRRDPNVLEVLLKRGPGQSVDWREGNHGHIFSVLGVSPDHEQLKILARRIHVDTTIRGD